jgi:hypothetical protein
MEHEVKDLDIVLSKEKFIKNLFDKIVIVAASANQVPLPPFLFINFLTILI